LYCYIISTGFQKDKVFLTDGLFFGKPARLFIIGLNKKKMKSAEPGQESFDFL